MAAEDPALLALIHAIAAGDTLAARDLLASSPRLATLQMRVGATRQSPVPYFFQAIQHYAYAGDTPLHIGAAAYHVAIVSELIKLGADVRARNRRGAEPLHYAVDGIPGSSTWNPAAQAATVTYLITAGADPNAVDKSGVTPLHRAVRTRCAAAVNALLVGGADVHRRNASGTLPMQLATQTTGRGGSGSPAARAEQAEIVRLLQQAENGQRG